MADPLNIFSLSASDFNAYLQEAAQYSAPSQIDFLRNEYRKRNSLSGLLDTVGEAGLEGKNVSSMLPIAGPAGMSLLDAARSGKLQTRFKDYVTDAVGALVGGIENPGMALKGLLADDEMLGAAMQTAGTAMLGGGAAVNAVRPSGDGLLASNMPPLKVFHGGSYNYGDEINSPFFVTPSRTGAQYFADEDVPFSSVSNFKADVSNVLDIDTPDGLNRFSEILEKYKIDHDYDPDGIYEKLEIFNIPNDIPYSGSNILDTAYIPEVQEALRKEGISALYSSSDALENTSIPAYAIIDPKILATANASKGAGLLAVLPEPRNQAEANAKAILELRAQGRASEVTNDMMAAADPQYMFNNTPLDMSENARMARASELGFDSDGLHGTGADIKAVDPKFFGRGEDILGTAFYTTTTPERANRYAPSALGKWVSQSGNNDFAEGANVMPLSLKESKPFNLEENLGSVADDIAAVYASDPFFDVKKMSSGVNIVSSEDGSAMLDPYMTKLDALQKLKTAFGPKGVSITLESLGYSGVSGPEAKGGRVRASYDPANIRSRFARFDPEFSDLSNLSAANANASVGALVLSQHARAKPALADILAQNGVDPANINAAPIQRVQAALETATQRQLIDSRSANSILQGFLQPELEDFYANANPLAGLLAMQQPQQSENRGLLQ